jgi:hypothetical protein
MSATSRRTGRGNRSIIGRVVNPKGLGVRAPPRRAKAQLLPGANAGVLLSMGGNDGDQ